MEIANGRNVTTSDLIVAAVNQDLTVTLNQFCQIIEILHGLRKDYDVTWDRVNGNHSIFIKNLNVSFTIEEELKNVN